MVFPVVLPVAIYDYAYEKLGLSKTFLEARTEKAKYWVPETQKMALRIKNGESHAIVAYTGGGKTVMGEWAIIDTQRRTLFLVPTRRLSKRQQRLFNAMGGKFQTRVIIGETPPPQRIWNDLNDRIIFATGHVVEEALKDNPDLLKDFQLLMMDEFHNAATEDHPYSVVAAKAKKAGIVRVGLSASPGSTEEKIKQTLFNCRLDKMYHIDIPVSRKIGSIIHAEEAEVYLKGSQWFIQEDIIRTEMRRTAMLFNSASKYAHCKIRIEPEKILQYPRLSKIKKQITRLFPDTQKENENRCLFTDTRTGGTLSSLLREYEVWSHIYQLSRKESFEAIDRYYEDNLKNNSSRYAQRMVKRGRIEQLMILIGKSLHPMLQQMEMVVQSLVRRGLQVLIFENNVATAKATKELLEKSGIKSALFFGSKHMKPAQQEEALELLEDRKVNCLIATSVGKEGYDFEVDVVVNHGSPKNVIDFIQGSGRAGRHEKDAEIIYIVVREERYKIYALDKAVIKLKLAKISQFASGPIPSESFSETEVPPEESEVASEVQEASNSSSPVPLSEPHTVHQLRLF